MTAGAFERLLYTDCRPGTGLGAGGGFQVQAQSPGVDSAQSAMAVGSLLYEVQNAWIVERRAVEDFPLGFAHAAGAGYGTAQSRYLGKEATGGRQGNHLTDCLLTRDPSQYATIRPAQLWRSPLWREAPWEATSCPPYEGAPEPGPLTLDAVTGWLRERADRAPVLARLLSVLEDPDGDRVVIVGSDAGEVMMWITAATLLLPQRQALDVTFKVFSSAPLRAGQRVVGAPAGLSPQLGPGRASGVFVLDADGCTADDPVTSKRAAFLVGKLAGDVDPYDVVDAVELADELSEGRGPADDDALRTGWALTLPDDPRPDAGTLHRWLAGASQRQLAAHGTAAAMMLLDSAPGAAQLRWLDAAVGAGTIGLDAEDVRARLLDAEVADVLGGHPVPQDPLSAVALSDQARRDAESKLASAILASSEGKLDGGQIDRALRLTGRHGIRLELSAPLRRQLEKFAIIWTDQPGAWDPRGWTLREEILDLAYQELRERFTSRGPAAVMDTLRAGWRYFADRVDDPDEPLHCHLQAAAIAAAAGEPRLRQLGGCLARIAALRRPGMDPSRASAAARHLQQALIDWQAVDTDVAIALLTELEAAEVTPEVTRYVDDYIAEATRAPDQGVLDLLASLHQLGWRPGTQDARRLLDAELAVREFRGLAADEKIMKDRYLVEAAKLISGVEPQVLKLRAGVILTCLTTTPSPDLAAEVLARIPVKGKEIARHRPAATLIALAGKRLHAAPDLERRVTGTLWCLRVLARLATDDKQHKRTESLEQVLRGLAAALGKADLDKWRDEVSRRMRHETPDVRLEWDRLFAQDGARPGMVQNLLLRRRP